MEAHQVTPLLKLIHCWSKIPLYHPLLERSVSDVGGDTVLLRVFSILKTKTKSMEVSKLLMSIAENLLQTDKENGYFNFLYLIFHIHFRFVNHKVNISINISLWFFLSQILFTARVALTYGVFLVVELFKRIVTQRALQTKLLKQIINVS